MATIQFHFQIERADDVVVGCAQVFRDGKSGDFDIEIIGDEPERSGFPIPNKLTGERFAAAESVLRARFADDIHVALDAELEAA